ncbi:hypothetical protein PLESTB_001490600 [Pleodorina starrii]|uniref:Uncharacterized protein n=1 Tax=Pleodorina starrii TaxID=330485 RepID=A0A9W6BX47_9CHLO|nr:hypothetical protein PLESTB_001490600 [Pleodorina starrii]GLC66331.1 hypothetical protein PLESTF_000412300 [Pleodorina starrii]
MSQEGILDQRKKFRFTPQTFAALFLALSLSAVFYALMHKIHDEGVTHPVILVLLPIPTIFWMLLMIPLFMFIAYQADFKGLNPLIPTHYIQIARRCFRAMKENDFKVSEKNL